MARIKGGVRYSPVRIGKVGRGQTVRGPEAVEGGSGGGIFFFCFEGRKEEESGLR